MTDPTRFSAVLDRGVQFVLSPRRLPPEFAVEQQVLASFGPLDLHAEFAIPGHPSDGMTPSDLDARLLPELAALPFGEALRCDIAALCADFARIAELSSVQVSVEIFDDDACRKWHTDRVGLRLLVTYAGPGTEWALPWGVDRSWLGRTSLELEAVNQRIVFDPAAIRRAAAGDVLLCKGDLFEGESEYGLVHRSPPIAQDAGWRLLVRLDEPRRCA